MSFDQFKTLVSATTHPDDYPLAAHIEQSVPIYHWGQLSKASDAAALAELDRALDSGPGIVAIKGAFPDPSVLENATALFERMIADEKSANAGKGDHFAKAGANDRVWNALQKHALAAPTNFADYYANPAIDLICRAWLGDGYQMTAQVNRVNPGGEAQTPHRDYHLGFMSTERMALFPDAVHALSPRLTLQGAIAHVDMPLEMGPTVYLPFSQRYPRGYLDFGKAQFQSHFAEHHVQLPLEQGDLVFFNPAVMHGSGNNTTHDRPRLANLVQVSSAFGRAMESVDRAAMCAAVYPELTRFDGKGRAALIAATAEGYAFPTNLDSDPPIGGMAPQTQAELLRQALAESWDHDDLIAALSAQEARRTP